MSIEQNVQNVNQKNITPYVNLLAAPTVNDDVTVGFLPGHTWLYNGVFYYCSNNITGAAVWNSIAKVSQLPTQYWSRASTTLSPLNSGDSLNLGLGNLSIDGGTVYLGQNVATNMYLGTGTIQSNIIIENSNSYLSTYNVIIYSASSSYYGTLSAASGLTAGRSWRLPDDGGEIALNILTGYSAASGTLSASDTIVQAFNKLGYDKHVAVTLATNHGLSLSGQQLALGTPSSITSSSTNSVTTTTHSHALDLSGLSYYSYISSMNQSVANNVNVQFSTVLSTQYNVGGSDCSIRFYDDLSKTTEQADIGVAGGPGHYCATANTGDFVIRNFVSSKDIVFGIGTTEIARITATAGRNASLYVTPTIAKDLLFTHAWFQTSSTVLNTSPTAAVGLSIAAGGAIGAVEFHTTSDERIKNVIGNSTGDLAKIKSLRVVDYQYKDQNTYGTKTNKGVIAQEVISVYPEAISQNITDFIPNIYVLSASTSVDLVNHLLTITTGNSNGLVEGDIVRLIFGNKKAEKEVLSVDGNTFVVTFNDDEELVNNQVFVYGKQIDDLMNVNYTYLTCANINAIKELEARVAALENK